MKFKKIILFSLLLIALSDAFAQETSLDRFSVSEMNGKVLLDWVIPSGNICQGIRIFRSIDSINFIQIGDIGGVCGKNSTPQAYSFTDINPLKNKINYYRLELGGIGISKIVSVEFIDFQYGGYQVRPNPINSDARIYFNSDMNTEIQFKIFTITGTEVYHTNEFNFNYFTIPQKTLQAGTYIFTIIMPGSSSIRKGKFTLLH